VPWELGCKSKYTKFMARGVVENLPLFRVLLLYQNPVVTESKLPLSRTDYPRYNPVGIATLDERVFSFTEAYLYFSSTHPCYKAAFLLLQVRLGPYIRHNTNPLCTFIHTILRLLHTRQDINITEHGQICTPRPRLRSKKHP
jgi:hypothetical protein